MLFTVDGRSDQTTIKKHWLKNQAQEGTMYQRCVKQSMLIAAQQIKLFDAEDPTSKITPQEADTAKAKLRGLQVGSERIMVSGSKKKTLRKIESLEERQRDVLVKFSKNCCVAGCGQKMQRRERSFIIDNGKLQIFYYKTKGAKLKDDIDLKEATCFYETRSTAQVPRWDLGYQERLRVDVATRQRAGKNPLYLYSDSPEKILRWKRAFSLAKVLVADNDRRALKVSIGRATSQGLLKAWEALSKYYHELSNTRDTVKQMAMRLMKVELSRGWTKMKLVYKKRNDHEQRMAEQRTWAARFMSEKLARLGDMNVRSSADVREHVITRIQQRFRRYREDMIFDRSYPLGPQMMSRVQQAKLGKMVDFEMKATTADNSIRLGLCKKSRVAWEDVRELLRGAKATYSEVNEPLSGVTFHVSDNLASLSFSAQSVEADAYSALNKADWSKYVNLDRISSIVLHSAPPIEESMAAKEDANTNSVWCTINGPRLSWDKRIVTDSEGNNSIRPNEERDGLAIPTSLARNLPVKWVTFKLLGASAVLHANEDSDTFKSIARIHMLGWSYDSEEAEGTSATYAFRTGFAQPASTSPNACAASVPVVDNEFVGPEGGEIAVEIFQSYRQSDQAEDAETTVDDIQVLRFLGARSIIDAFGNLSEKLQNNEPFSEQVPLSVGTAPFGYGAKPAHGSKAYASKSSVTLKFQVEISRDGMPVAPMATARGERSQCVSPELVGGGVCTSVFTSHRQAWYDSDLGVGKFRIDHVANFVELSLGTLRFPQSVALGDGSKKYRIQATIGGVCMESIALHRPADHWTKVIGATYGDVNAIRYSGDRLFLPLPPGCWGSGDEVAQERRKIELRLLECDNEFPGEAEDFLNFLQRHSDPQKARAWQAKPIYHALLTFDHFMVDRVKTLTVYMSVIGHEVAEVNVHSNIMTNFDQSQEEVALSVDFALRDRDYVKGMLGEATEKRSLCVGDKAMMSVSEPLIYPDSDKDFRRRFCPGTWKTPGHAGDPWEKRGCLLRQPCLSSEYHESGLGDLVPKEPFTQSFIPAFCKNIIPHKFVVPITEKSFLDRRLPGFYPQIMQDLAYYGDGEARTFSGRHQGAAAKIATQSGMAKPQCQYLREMNKQVPVTLLCMYADGTCDVELAAAFLENWCANKKLKYKMPGYLEKGHKVNGLERCVLKRVPKTLISAVHYSGINMYDSSFKTTMDVVNGRPPMNDFNPCAKDAIKNSKNFAIAAGPMPPDASNGACQYEWSIRVRSPSEFEMYQLAAMLRRCHRMDHYQQSSKMAEYRSRVSEMPVLTQQPYIQRPIAGGQLDVVLVECRRLMPRQSFIDRVLHADPATMSYQSIMHPTAHTIRSDRPIDENYLPDLMGTTAGEARMTPVGTPISCFVNFRMLHNRGEVIPYRGQKVQQSAICSGTDSPNWSKMRELRQSGGWTFRTGTIDPEKHPDLIIDFEVRQASVGFSRHIGSMQLPVTQRQFLTNPNEPFKNLWLPLVTVRDGKATANPTGELHIMTRWLPAEKIQIMADGTQKQQLSVRSLFLKELYPKLCVQRLKEPIYQIEAQYLHYNPNLVRTKTAGDKQQPPEAPKDHFRRHAEELANAVPYVECLERRQTQAWDEFEQGIDAEQPGVRLAERRLMWIEKNNLERLQTLAELVQRGIPSTKRERMWQELTLASRVMERDGTGAYGGPGRLEDGEAALRAAEQEYTRLLERGLPQTSDAMKQLQEDGFHIASWDSTVPPVPQIRDLHLKRISQAQNVCTALLAMPDSGIAYCESLLVLAFFLLLPQGCKEERNSGDGAYCYMSESSAFWMLYTLISTRVNGAYREYYGIPQAEGADESYKQPPSLCAGSGAMQDVFLLECCLAYHEHDVWQKMNALGFQLSSVFYGAFMRLYATYMPTASVFRLWDILFAQSTDPRAQPHNRAHLIDLAFGVIRSRKSEIKQCESAHEIKQLILGVLGSMYDTCTVVDITMLSHQYLWFGTGFSSGKVCTLWTQRDDLFKAVNMTLTEQNEILKQLTHLLPLKMQAAASQRDEARVAGVTTKDLAKEVLYVLQQSLQNLKPLKDKDNLRQTWGMHRPMPLAARVLCENSFEKFWHGVQQQLRNLNGPGLPPNPFKIRPLPSSRPIPGLEPLDITTSDLASVLERDLPSWAQHARSLWNAFTSRQDLVYLMGTNQYGAGNYQYGADYGNAAGQYNESTPLNSNAGNAYPGYPGANPYGPRPTAFQKMLLKLFNCEKPDDLHSGPIGSATSSASSEEQFSLNELFIALICSSRGSVGEKANALFNIYSYSDPTAQRSNHIQGVTKLAKSIATIQAEGANDSLGRTLSPPDPDSMEAKMNNVLRFSVWTNYPNGRRKMGDVLVPNLSSFVSFMGQEPQVISYNIWGDPSKERGGKKKQSGMVASTSSDQWNIKNIVCIGELNMSITWTPTSIRKSDEGQLGIHVRFIKFYSMYVSDYYKINPWIEVSIAKGDENTRHWGDIERWDPRNALLSSSTARSKLTTHGAYGGIIKYDATMYDSSFFKQGEKFSSYYRDSKGMGLDQETHQWQWNEVWGKQFSIEKLQVPPDFVKLSQRKNVMDMQGVRLICSGILQRCVLQMTNRQAALISEATFNRQGVVPGILKAILVPGSDITKKKMEDIEKDFTGPGLTQRWTDVTAHIVLEHEKQMAMNGGLFNLFAAAWLAQDPAGSQFVEYGFKNMHLDDPLPKQPKVLWIRYIRGGDGERCMHAVKFDAENRLMQPEPGIGYSPEVPMEQIDIWPQTKVTKEEFISCILTSPVLGESLRRLGSCDHVLHAKKLIPLDVTIMDPHREEEDEQINDVLDVQQSILLEVWDADVGSSKDFLGEAWLPPLSNFSKRMKDIVLPLSRADYSDDAINGPSRKDASKEIGDDTKDPHKKVTGELYISASWDYPVWKELGQETDFNSWMLAQGVTDKIVEKEQRSDILTNEFIDVKTLAEKWAETNGKVLREAFKKARNHQGLQFTDKERKILDQYFKEHTQAEDVHHRAVMQEKLHTGVLTIKIREAKSLRCSDIKKYRYCDPQVIAYARNDHLNQWRKKKVFNTKIISNNRNPEWNQTFTESFLTGAYEARYKMQEHGFMAEVSKQMLKLQPTKARHMKEDRELAYVKRFGTDGLRVKFSDQIINGPTSQVPGENHKIEVMIGDSIREFKAKLSAACQKEANFWKNKNEAEASKYNDISIGYKHLVMVFVPSVKVQKLYAQKMHEGEEYKRAYRQAMEDPSNWQPLDPARSFAQYTQFFQRGMRQAVMLRVVEETPSYKAQNLRYKLFEEEQNKLSYQDRDDKKTCYGWAKYTHQADGSMEWRPAFISRSDENAKLFNAQWVFEPRPADADGGRSSSATKTNNMPQEVDTSVDLARDGVLLQPRVPKLEDDVNEEHREFLQQAVLLRSSGKSDWEIEVTLNKLLNDKFNSQKQTSETRKAPDPITVDEIRLFLQRKEEEGAKAAAHRTNEIQSGMKADAADTRAHSSVLDRVGGF